jgi:hypothetical protein
MASTVCAAQFFCSVQNVALSSWKVSCRFVGPAAVRVDVCQNLVYSCGCFCSNHLGNESFGVIIRSSVYLYVPTMYMGVSDYVTDVGVEGCCS